MLEFLRRRIRPYELQKGETDKVVENAFVEIANGGRDPRFREVLQEGHRRSVQGSLRPLEAPGTGGDSGRVSFGLPPRLQSGDRAVSGEERHGGDLPANVRHLPPSVFAAHRLGDQGVQGAAQALRQALRAGWQQVHGRGDKVRRQDRRAAPAVRAGSAPAREGEVQRPHHAPLDTLRRVLFDSRRHSALRGKGRAVFRDSATLWLSAQPCLRARGDEKGEGGVPGYHGAAAGLRSGC